MNNQELKKQISILLNQPISTIDKVFNLLEEQGIIHYHKTTSKEIKTTTKGIGINSNVYLSNAELKKIQERWCNTWEEKIDRLSSYMINKNKKYSSHYLTLLRWFGKEPQEKKIIVMNNNINPIDFET